MTYVMGKMDDVSTDSFKFSTGRGKFIGDLNNTPIRDARYVDSPAFRSTCMPVNASSSPSQGVTLSSLSDTADPALNNLITHIGQQVGQSLEEPYGLGLRDMELRTSHNSFP